MERQAFEVRDLVFVLLTLAVFAVLGLVVKAVERL
ncbi:potassium-transporting ATPase [Pseudofrankia inefficax]